MEDYFDVGDISLFYGTLKHGVKTISSKDISSKTKNRWWACLTNPVSDEIKTRETQKAIY